MSTQEGYLGMKQLLRAWFDKFGTINPQYGLKYFVSDHSLFVQHSFAGSIILVIYVGDVMIYGDDLHGIVALKEFLSTHFHMKDLGNLRYFLGV